MGMNYRYTLHRTFGSGEDGFISISMIGGPLSSGEAGMRIDEPHVGVHVRAITKPATPVPHKITCDLLAKSPPAGSCITAYGHV